MLRSRRSLAPHHDDDERAEREDRRGAGEAHRAHDDQAVAAGHRVVVIAVEQQRVDRRADLAGRRFDEREPQIARAVLDAEQIARQPAVRRQRR